MSLIPLCAPAAVSVKMSALWAESSFPDMKICVFCGSAAGHDECYSRWAEELGSWIGSGGHTLVYGGAKAGLMGILADRVLACGGKVIGVIPDVELIQSRRHTGLTETIETGSMSDRKAKMIEISDAFIALPGGPGTLDEITDVVTLTRIGVNKKPLVLFDGNGYYRPLKAVFDAMLDAGFADACDFSNLLFSSDWKAIGQFICGA